MAPAILSEIIKINKTMIGILNFVFLFIISNIKMIMEIISIIGRIMLKITMESVHLV